MTMSMRMTHLGMGIAAVFAMSCGGAPEGVENEDVRQSKDELFKLQNNTLWNDNSLGTGALIPVCFAVRPIVNGTTITWPFQSATTDRDGATIVDLPGLRFLIRQAILDSWVRYGNIELTGWADCPIDGVTNLHNYSQLANRIVINFSSVDESQVGKLPGAPTMLTYNHQAVQNFSDKFNVIHEFGHALGFDHEWLRADYQTNGQACQYPSEQGTYLTQFADKYSKLQYQCPTIAGVPGVDPDRNNYLLSAGDIVGVRKAYGGKASGSIVGYAGMCVWATSTTLDSGVVAFSCRNTDYDKWFRDGTSSQRMELGQLNKCLTVANGTAPNPVQSLNCVDTAATKFTLTGMEWRAMGNLCVKGADNGTGNLKATICDGSDGQKWDFMNPVGGLNYNQIKHVKSGKCVTAGSASGTLNEPLTLATCSSTDAQQKFYYTGNNVIAKTATSNSSQLCANVKTGKFDYVDHDIQLYGSCNGTPTYNARFTARGQIKVLGNCMQIDGFGFLNDPISVAACNSNVTQQWEYYF